MSPENNEELLVRIVSKYEFKTKTLEYTTCFYQDRFVILYKDRKIAEISYNDILQVIKNKKNLRFNLDDGSHVKIPCTDAEKKEIFAIFKMRRLGTTHLSTENVIGLALVEFANLRFLIPIDTVSFLDFKKKAIRRIGEYFFPSQSLDFVSLEHYNELSFHIKKDESLVILENDDDLVCALLYFDKRLEVLVKHIVNES